MKDSFEKLLYFLARLEEAHISFSLHRVRDETIMVRINVPGQKWEVEFFQDGSVEVEIFKSDGEIHDEAKLKELFANFSD